ncbi:sterol regulatory element-binding protein cleavage-activating protein-like isoform X2 [Pomacea canaliculata]|uniref:sterol regulatory element-binding protein cleavage-activating protein-like isoform X2 n=1 Tax=Pomacea canaliculata TaxID=400727 RepID=UPI000D72DBE1|nr:sterol regulatory element-binding protein cleavage-activating protein-like isoform X2 [Pomacea canaliculata]
MKLLRHRIAQVYYTHGLFCASHPYSILITVCTIILITCYPLINLPLPGNAPQEFKSQLSSYSVPSRVYTAAKENESDEDLKRPRWYVGPPVGFVQQFVIKSAVSPWHPQQMIPTDAFRAPLSRVFQVLHEVESFQHQTRDGMQAIQDICLHISEPISSGHIKNLLPQYSCFMVSPANLWHSDHRRFSKDPEIIKTVYQKYGQTIETPPTIKDLLFGLPWKDTGISRYFIRNRQRVISYAITIILKKYDKGFISALRERLERAFPETSLNVNNTEVDSLVHVHYKDFNYIVEYTPLLVTYFVLLLYIYFSVRKIEMVKSQFGLAVSAVVTVVSSLFMSLSLCFFFGLNPTLNGSEIFPYLVMLIGLENVLVITKSVVSTPVHLDVKIRVAQGLSKEGWYITKNLCTELFIIFIGFFTFVPAIQEFCLFALVGLWTDFFLQMLFFATILSVDIRRMELADLHRQSVQQGPEQDLSTSIQPLIQCPFASRLNPQKRPSTPCASSHPNFDRVSPAPSAQRSTPTPYSPISSSLTEDLRHSTPKIYRSKSAPRLDIEYSQELSQTAPQQSQEAFFQNMPRRLRLFYFWARTRIFQRLIMVCTVIWIALIVYKTGLVEQLANLEDSSMSSPATGQQHLHQWGDHPFSSDMMRERSLEQEADSPSLLGKGMWWGRDGGEEPLEAGLVEHTQLEAWRGLSHKHWPRLLALYNISILGRYISILPSIHLSIIVDPQVALQERHPSESQGYLLPSQSLPTQESHSSTENKQNIWSYSSDNTQYTMYNPEQLKAFYPKSKREFVITICLSVLSVIVITYFMVALYKCMCSRNYSRWRHSLARYKARRQRAKGTYYKQIKDAVPIILTGHNQEIECVAVDGQFVVSCCLGGQLRMWDSNTGECISIMQRYSITPPRRRRPCVGRNIEDSDADLYAEYHGDKMTPESTSSSEGSFIDRNRLLERRSERNRHVIDRYRDLGLDLVSSINTDFVAMDPQPDADHTQGYDFKRWLDGVSTEHFQPLSDVPFANRKIPSADGNCTVPPGEDVRARSWSQGDSTIIGDPLLAEDGSEGARASAIWCLTVKDGLIIAGCGNGRIEMWEGETGRLKYQYNVSSSGVTAVCFTGNRIIAARVDGSLDVFELETFQNSSVLSPSSAVSARPHRGHTRQYSAGNLRPLRLWEEVVRLNCIASFRAHQRPITCLQCEGNRIVTASQDHTLKVYRLDGRDCLYTLYGHEDHVTALCLDKCPPYAAASGSADGTMRLWDLVTGSCIHKFMWHKQAIIRLATSLQFIVSLGQDDCMCVLDRTRGQLLHKISMESFGSSLVLMPHNLAVTGAQGKLELWDLSRGCLVRPVPFQDGDSAFITHLETLNSNSLVCAAGTSLKVISFPTTLEKAE